jgi:hypothetical protein
MIIKLIIVLFASSAQPATAAMLAVVETVAMQATPRGAGGCKQSQNNVVNND